VSRTKELWIDPTSEDEDGFVIGEYESRHLNMDVKYLKNSDVVEYMTKLVAIANKLDYYAMIEAPDDLKKDYKELRKDVINTFGLKL